IRERGASLRGACRVLRELAGKPEGAHRRGCREGVQPPPEDVISPLQAMLAGDEAHLVVGLPVVRHLGGRHELAFAQAHKPGDGYRTQTTLVVAVVVDARNAELLRKVRALCLAGDTDVEAG